MLLLYKCCIMGLRDKVALLYATVFLLIITQILCMPNLRKRLYSKSSLRNTKQMKNFKSEESIYKTYGFPKMEYAGGYKPRTYYPFDEYNKNCATKEPMKNKTNYKDLKVKINKKRNKYAIRKEINKPIQVLSEFSSKPNYREIGYFPEVEYPLKANDIWKPNYWDSYPIYHTDQSNYRQCNIGRKYNKFSEQKTTCSYQNNNKGKPFENKLQFYNQSNSTAENLKTISSSIMTLTTSSPYSNDFVMTDKNTIMALTKAPVSIEEEIQTVTTKMPIYTNTSKDITEGIYNTENITKGNIYYINNTSDPCSKIEKNRISLEDKTLYPEQNIVSNDLKSNDQEKGNCIEDDKEFSTDEPEYVYAFSTPMPHTSNAYDNLWKESQVLEPHKEFSNPDELSDYFIAA